MRHINLSAIPKSKHIPLFWRYKKFEVDKP